MNVKVAEVMVDLLIDAKKLQEISASSGQEKQIFELLFEVAQAAHAGMAALTRNEQRSE
jgi:hypothetical protein